MNERTPSSVVDQLLTLGRPVGYEPADWHRSVVSGMTREHVPDLVRLLDDPSLNGETTEEPQAYAPIHAWRAIGDFKAVEAVPALIRCLEVRQRWENFDDWSIEEIPKVLVDMGPDAIAPMVDAMQKPTTEPHSAGVLAEALAKIAKAHPEQRENIVARLIEIGERFADRAHDANDGFVVALLDLKALEAAPLLRRMFHARAVNLEVVGDWGDARRELHLERLPDDPPERKPGESLWNPDSPGGQLAKLARKLKLEGKWKAIDALVDPPAAAPAAKHTAQWHRQQAKKRKQQTRRC
jgi:hypothetical protein